MIVTGGAGFVGRNFIRYLYQTKTNMKDVTVIDYNKEYIKYVKKYGAMTIHADLSYPGDWYDEFKHADIIINLAAQLSSSEYDPFYRNNVLTVKNIIEAMKNSSVDKIIHFSSASVLSQWQDNYSKTKKEGEDLVVNSGLNYCIIQPSIMYGPTDETNIGYLIDYAKKIPFFPIPGHGKWTRQPIYIDDISQLLVKLSTNFPSKRIISVNGKEVIYFKDMVNIVLKELGGIKIKVYLPIKLFIFLMNAYQKILRLDDFTSDQVRALTTIETFPEEPWWDEFNIPFTSFKSGAKAMIDHKELI